METHEWVILGLMAAFIGVVISVVIAAQEACAKSFELLDTRARTSNP